MAADVARLLAANALELAVGLGVVLALRLPRPLAYVVGLAVVGVLDANLALVHALLGLPELAVLAAVSLLVGLRLKRGREPEAEPRTLVTTLLGCATPALLALSAFVFATRPLSEWDGWAIWGLRAHALFLEHGTGAVFASSAYAQPSYPLLLPSLEATGYRAMGTADATVVHLQLALLAVAFAEGLAGLLRRRVPPALIALTGLAILATPEVLGQLRTNYADIPLAFFVALGLLALARWLDDGGRALLALTALFFAAAALTKNEGTVFAGAALAVAFLVVIVHDRRRALALVPVAIAVVATVLPWRVYTKVHHLAIGSVRPADALRPGVLAAHAGRGATAAQSLLAQLPTARWGLLAPLFAVALVTGFLYGRRRLAIFAAAWFACSFAGLVVDYWVSPLPLHWYLSTSADRVVASLVVGCAALAPLLVADSWRGVRLLSPSAA